LAHTASRGAASWTSPFIVMAMDGASGEFKPVPQVMHGSRKGKAALR
jgi:hypothetical protein